MRCEEFDVKRYVDNLIKVGSGHSLSDDEEFYTLEAYLHTEPGSCDSNCNDRFVLYIGESENRIYTELISRGLNLLEKAVL